MRCRGVSVGDFVKDGGLHPPHRKRAGVADGHIPAQVHAHKPIGFLPGKPLRADFVVLRKRLGVLDAGANHRLGQRLGHPEPAAAGQVADAGGHERFAGDKLPLAARVRGDEDVIALVLLEQGQN